MLIDTHCHLQFGEYDADREDIIAQCKEKGIGLLIPGCDYESSKKAIACAQGAGDGVWAAVGCHPTEDRALFSVDDFLRLVQSSKKVVAIGECGLDYYRVEDLELRVEQKNMFRKHIELACKNTLPLIIHCRDAHEDTAAMLLECFGEWEEGERERGVLHCFTGTVSDAIKYRELGFLISFTGIITFSHQYDGVVQNVPLDKILVETDAPFLAPIPNRGKRNSPLYVTYIAQRIAELKDVSLETVSEQTTKNARRLFKFL